jgi:Skp family chaperone for outer membrane proteins
MKLFARLLPLAAFVFLICNVASAQNASGAPAPTKVGILNSNAFGDEKNGIRKFVTALKGVDAQFNATRTEITSLQARLRTLVTELEALEKNPQTQRAVFQQKVDEAAALERQIKFKTEDASALYEARKRVALQPVQESLFTAMQEYAKAKGYALIFDKAKDSDGLLIAIGNQSVDVTQDFIAFYNARP